MFVKLELIWVSESWIYLLDLVIVVVYVEDNVLKVEVLSEMVEIEEKDEE